MNVQPIFQHCMLCFSCWHPLSDYRAEKQMWRPFFLQFNQIFLVYDHLVLYTLTKHAYLHSFFSTALSRHALLLRDMLDKCLLFCGSNSFVALYLPWCTFAGFNFEQVSLHPLSKTLYSLFSNVIGPTVSIYHTACSFMRKENSPPLESAIIYEQCFMTSCVAMPDVVPTFSLCQICFPTNFHLHVHIAIYYNGLSTDD